MVISTLGRCAIVLPDGFITGDGVKARIREKLLSVANLHTIVRLSQSTFFPATVSTNLLFFEKGKRTKEIWYWNKKPLSPKSKPNWRKVTPRAANYPKRNPIFLEWEYIPSKFFYYTVHSGICLYLIFLTFKHLQNKKTLQYQLGKFWL